MTFSFSVDYLVIKVRFQMSWFLIFFLQDGGLGAYGVFSYGVFSAGAMLIFFLHTVLMEYMVCSHLS